MSARRDWVLTLVAACLLVALGCVLWGWTIPQLLAFAASPVGLILAGWFVLLALALLLVGRAADRGDAMADRALERRRGDPADWRWPARDVEVGRR